MRWRLIGCIVLLGACKRPPEAAVKCEALLWLICTREADCEMAANPREDRATLIADCKAVFDCAKARQLSGPYETCRADIAASTCQVVRNHQRSLVSFLLSAESPLPSCNAVLIK
jgi:hypothetical protein